MEADPLQQLRGIHLPAEPSWWPPAPGWWLLAALALAALAWGLWAMAARWRRFAPARVARALCRDAYLEAQAGSLSPIQYLHRINELLKRFAIHGISDAAAKPLSGDPWLRYLDRRYGQAAFTRGAGRWLGAQRFRPGSNIQMSGPKLEDMNRLISRFFARECSFFWKFWKSDRPAGEAPSKPIAQDRKWRKAA